MISEEFRASPAILQFYLSEKYLNDSAILSTLLRNEFADIWLILSAYDI